MLDPAGMITTWNAGAEKIKGYKAEEIIGKNFSFFFTPEAIKNEYPAKELRIASEQGRYEEEGWRVRKDGSKFWANVIVSAIRDTEGKLIGYGKITRDLSEYKKVAQMKNEFISVISHELRTPLTSIRGSLGLIAGGAVGTFSVKAKQFIDIASKNCERLLLLINDILDIEKIESGKMDFQLKVINLKELVKEAIFANKIYGEKSGIVLKLLRSPNDIKVNVDPARLMQVLTNLISNAIKFSPPHEKVKLVIILLPNDTVRVNVIDKGPGIPKEFYSNIFQRFAQADSSDRRDKSGTGLGLNISKSIIEKLGGTLNFNSQPNKKTIFYIDLPIVKLSTVEALPTLTKLLNQYSGRLLVCEDDEDQAKYLKMMLENEGFQVDIALNVAEANKLLAENVYTALLLDLILPDQDGISFIRQLRKSTRTHELSIIVISVIVETGRNLLNGEAFSIIDWLDKPIDFNELLRSIMQIKKQIFPRVPRVLHIEDDVDTQRLIATALENYAEVVAANTLYETREKLKKNSWDLVILDLLLPDGNGAELLPLLVKYKLPIIVFSASELNIAYSQYVKKTLVKSHSSTKKLLETIQVLLAK